MPLLVDPEIIAHIRVVVVENDLLTRVKLRTDILGSKDITIVGEARDNEAALLMADDLRPDVVIMEDGMPTNSSEVARKILKKHGNIGVMMLTLRQDEHDIFASLDAGVTGYCMKDAGAEHLHTAIRSVFAGDTWMDAENASKMLIKYNENKPSIIATDVELPCTTFFTHGTDAKSVLELPILPILAAREIEPEELSTRELEVINLIVEGLSNRDIAKKLIVSLATAKSHVRNVLSKLSVTNRTQAAISAMKRGIV